MLKISPLTSDYGSVTLGSSSMATSFTVTNTGNATSGTVAITIEGATTDFQVSSNTCQTLAVAATCTVGVVFTPSVSGARNATLHAAVAGNSTTAAITGIGANPGNLMVAPSSTPFGNVQVGQTSAMVATIVVTNSGTAATGSLTVQATGSDPTQFTKLTDTCNGQTLAGGATCMITANFKPTSAGAKSASFTVIGNPGGTVSAAVSGTGFTAAQLVAVPSAQDFGSVVTGTTSSNVTINVANSGGQATGTLTSAITGANASDFAIVTSNCTGTLAASSTCSLVLRFTPSSNGAKTATFTINGTPGGSATTTLSGAGIAAGALTITPSAATFPNTIVGGTTAATSFTIKNTGGTATGILAESVIGTNASEFQLSSGTCVDQPLAAGASCTVSVVFHPSSVGAKSGTLTVSASPGGTVTASLSGNATPTAQLTISPNSNDFGTVGIGAQTAFASFTITNSGGGPTGVPTVTFGGSAPGQFDSVNDCTAAIQPLASCTVMVRFKPTQTGLLSATFSVTATPGGTVTASVFGEGGQPAQITVLPSSLGFTGTVGDTSATQSFTVQNQGNTATGPITITAGGANAGDFSSTNTCTTLAAGATCTVTVAFVPTATGNRTATFAVAGSPGGTANVAVSGTANARLEILSIGGGAPANPFDFQSRALNSSTPATIVLRNNTTTSQTLTAVGTFPPPGGFSISGCNGVPIAAGATCTGTITFAPTSAGPSTGSITYAIGTGAVNEAVQNVMGSGQSALTWTAETTADFGNIVIGSSSVERLFDLKNVSTTSAATSLAFTGITAPFAITSNTCGATLAANTICKVGLTFSPTTTTLAHETLTATSAGGGNATIDVTGTGVNATDLNLSPAPTAFGNVFAGTTKDITVVVTNPAGAQPAGVMTFGLSAVSPAFAPAAPAFTILNNMSAGDCVSGTTALSNGQACNIRIRFAPITFGQKTGTLTVNATPGTPNTGVTSQLSGTSVSTVSVTPTPFDFGLLQSGATATQTFVVHNDSPAAVVFGAGASVLGGTHTAMSISADGCSSTTLQANATCSVSVTFAPTVFTQDNATLTVSTTPANGVATAVITAKGNNRAPTDIGLSNNTINENQFIGTTIGTLTTTDPDVGQTFTYTLPAGTPDNASFAISGSTLKSNAVYDFETKASYSIVIRTTDQDGAFFDKPFTITIGNLDDPPVAVNDTATVIEDTLTTIDVLANDTDQDGGPKQVTAVSATSAQGGTVAITGTGSGVDYKPPANFCTSNPGQTITSDSFTYTLAPTATAPLNPANSTATVTVNVTCVDDAPVAVADHPTVFKTTPKVLDVIANDTDVDCANISGNLCGPKQIASVTPPVKGTVSINPGSLTLTYTAPAGLCGPSVDMFTYTLAPGGSTTTVTIDVDCSVSVTWTGVTSDVTSSDFNNASIAFSPIPSGLTRLTITNTSAIAHSHGGAVTIGIQLHDPSTSTFTTIYTNVLDNSNQEPFNNFTVTFPTQQIDGLALISNPGQNQTWHTWDSGTTFTFSP